ncbi:hypothetical protein DXG01_001741 [Tephrocybe rancida]|nr:hypothetical protein DXG01_001741 [Tephrocybe rancida]
MSTIPEDKPSMLVDSEETRACSRCRNGRIPVTDTRKMCSECRERNRIYSQRSQNRALATIQDQQNNGKEILTAKRKTEDSEEAVHGTKKRVKKVHTASNQSPAENGGNAKEKAKKAPINRSYGVEYLTAEQLYTTLTASSKSKKYNFRGHFAIVANPKTDHLARVRLVAKDLRKIADIPFESISITSSANEDEFRATFQCTCLGRGTTKPVASLVWPQPGVFASNPPGHPNTKHRDDAPNGTTPAVQCKGRINVIAEADMSHPVGIVGQRITITVEH